MNTKFLTGFLKHFPTPNILAMPSVGVEVTPEAIRFLELKQHGDFYSVGRFGEYLLKGGDEDSFPNTKEVKDGLSTIKKEYKLNLVSVALPEEKAYIFCTDVPHLSPHEIRAGLELKLEEYVPIPPSESVFDYRIVNANLSNERVRVGVSVIPSLVVNRYLDVFLAAGLTPVSFDISAQVAVNALMKRDDHDPSIVVNFGKFDSHLYLVSSRTVHFTSTVSVGGKALTEAVQKYFKVDEVEAEKIKTERGITRKKEDSELSFSIVNILSALKDEIEKLVSYWNSHRERYTDKREKVKKIILCGSESSLSGRPEYLEANLEIPVLSGNVWENIFSFEAHIPPISRDQSLSYASVVGLSIKD